MNFKNRRSVLKAFDALGPVAYRRTSEKKVPNDNELSQIKQNVFTIVECRCLVEEIVKT